jgi:hypothetical protein
VYRQPLEPAWRRYLKGALLFAACLIGFFGFYGYFFAARICAFDKPGRYCSYDQLSIWLRDQHGWRALLIASAVLAVLGFFAWLGDSLDESAASEDPAAPDRGSREP